MVRLIFLLLLIAFSQNTFAQFFSSQWKYIPIDNNRDKWGDYAEPKWLRYFGLDMKDVNGDGYAEILAGRHVYINPGENMDANWKKTDLGMNADGIFLVDVDGDEFADVIAQALPSVYWFEATNKELTEWKSIKIAEVPATSHVNSQGFEKAQLFTGGKEELLIAGDGDIYAISIPEKNAEKGNWEVLKVGANSSDEGIGIGDIDGDGLADIAAGRRAEGEYEPTILVWWKNPGGKSAEWESREIGKSNHPIDRVEVADLNGDGKADIIMAEERYPGLEPDGNLFWFENPQKEDEKWQKHRLVTQYSMNNLDVKDLDGDGDQDIVTSEHKGLNLELQAWENDGKGNFSKHILDKGKEAHLGTQLLDMDNDGDFDLVSIGWDKYEHLHLWRNDGMSKSGFNWKYLSTTNNELPLPAAGNQQTASLVADVDKDGDADIFITERTKAPAVSWLRYTDGKWEKYIVDKNPLRIEAGSTYSDIDGDGDLDIVFAGEGRSNEVWWWENPYPNYDKDKGWVRRTIKKSGKNKHHDQLFGDFDGDGKQELAFWNQQAQTLFLAEIPNDPKNAEEWDYFPVYSYSTDSEMYPTGKDGYPGWKDIHEHEGLAKADIDGDGYEDIIGGGRWFKYLGDRKFQENIIDASYVFTRSAVGDFIEGGRPEVLLVVGDGVAPLMMYEWQKGTWVSKQLTGLIDNGHTIQTGDFNGDGHWDIFSAEMRFGEGNPDSKIQILFGNGRGEFQEHIVATGYGVHEGRMADLDGDGAWDVLGKPYTSQSPSPSRSAVLQVMGYMKVEWQI
ncbi:MAG: VCBS repeat-containing protein, partial [Bacteroidota bacterium]